MTQTQLAEKAGIDGPYLSRIMQGHYHLTPTVQLGLHRATGIALDDLELRDDRPTPAGAQPATSSADAKKGTAA